MKSRSVLLAALISICLLFITCTRHAEKNVVETKRDMLTQDTLFYEEQILWWNSSAQTVSFKRGSSDNSNDLSNAWFKYEKKEASKQHCPTAKVFLEIGNSKITQQKFAFQAQNYPMKKHSRLLH
jgi:hypothetical protein